MKKVIIPFLNQCNYRENMKMKFRVIIDRILFIQRHFKKYIALKKARIQLLLQFWENQKIEIDLMSRKLNASN